MKASPDWNYTFGGIGQRPLRQDAHIQDNTRTPNETQNKGAKDAQDSGHALGNGAK
jgi:hypothetical protein